MRYGVEQFKCISLGEPSPNTHITKFCCELVGSTTIGELGLETDLDLGLLSLSWLCPLPLLTLHLLIPVYKVFFSICFVNTEVLLAKLCFKLLYKTIEYMYYR